MPALNKPFKHKPFEGEESIRLIRILPGEQAADMICSIDIFNFSFDVAPRYAALSYTWGPPEQTRIIRCDGASLAVTENLFQALQHLQTRFYQLPAQNPRFLWVDAVCINQSDLQEKREQVLLMQSIFRNAQKVIIWLGEESNSPSSYSKHSGLLPDDPPPRDNNLLPYLSRSYWTRVWTLQEVIFGQRKSILLDYAELDWDYFWSGITSVVGKLGDHTCRPQLQQGLQFYSLTSSMSALNILLEDPNLVALDPTLSPRAWAEFYQVTKFASKLHASDPRDKLYSLLGITSALGVKLPPPDYTKPVDVVFQEAREFLVIGCNQAKSRRRTVFTIIPQALQNREHGTAKRDNVPKTHAPLPLRTQSGPPQSPTTSHSQSLTPTSQSLDEVASDHSDSDESLISQDDLKVERPWYEAVKKLIDENKRALLRTVIEHLGLCQHGGVPIVSCGKGQNSSQAKSQESNRSGRNTDKANKKHKTGCENAGAIGRYERSNDDEDDDDDELEERRPRKQLKKPSKDVSQDPYACPYFQRNCQNPQLHGACRGPGFKALHRLKEHLNRVHHIYQCDRCGKIFATADLLTSHRRVPAKNVCELTEWEISFDRDKGFADAQQVSIGLIKHNNTAKPWNGIFKVLFPEDPESSYPPPHYSSDSQLVQHLHQFQAYWTQQSQILLPQRLANVPFSSNLTEQDRQEMRHNLVEFVNQLGTELIRSYQHHVHQLAPDEADTASRISVPEPNSNVVIEPSPIAFQPAIPPAMATNAPILPFYNPSLPTNPPNPHFALLELLDEIEPVANVDLAWPMGYFANYSSHDSYSHPTAHPLHNTGNASNINPQLLQPEFERSGTGSEMTVHGSHVGGQNVGRHVVEGGWEMVPGRETDGERGQD